MSSEAPCDTRSPMRAVYDVPAPAKLNLFLHIVGRRPDGYHLLQSVFVLIDWCDTLHVERRADGRIARHDLNSSTTEPLPADDLCVRAARALQLASGCAWGADISLDKQVPSGAGMGGGSSDAASSLLALNRLWGLHWPLERLLPIGLALGADVPFFLNGHNAWVEGIGERLLPVRLAPQRFAVVKPAAGIQTRELFGHPAVVRDSEVAILEGFDTVDGILDGSAFGAAGGEAYGRNDLQAAAQALCGDVAAVCEWLSAHFGNSRMTGSGSAVFARVGADGYDHSKESPMSSLPAGWRGRMCHSLPQHPLAGWAAGARSRER